MQYPVSKEQEPVYDLGKGPVRGRHVLNELTRSPVFYGEKLDYVLYLSVITAHGFFAKKSARTLRYAVTGESALNIFGDGGLIHG